MSAFSTTGAVTVYANVTAGSGGAGFNAGNGADVTLINAVTGTTRGALSLIEFGTAGSAGIASGGNPGIAGNAVGSLTLTDLTAASLSANVIMVGGSRGGAGGSALTSVSLTGAKDVTVQATAAGGGLGLAGARMGQLGTVYGASLGGGAVSVLGFASGGQGANLVGGGIAAGATADATLVKEAWEEAGIPPALASIAMAAGKIEIRRDQPDGLQWETIFAYDLWLPAAFTPANQDGEAVAHLRVDFAEAARLIGCAPGCDEVTADASLVVLDCLLRHGAIDPAGPHFGRLAALRHSEWVAG